MTIDISEVHKKHEILLPINLKIMQSFLPRIKVCQFTTGEGAWNRWHFLLNVIRYALLCLICSRIPNIDPKASWIGKFRRGVAFSGTCSLGIVQFCIFLVSWWLQRSRFICRVKCGKERNSWKPTLPPFCFHPSGLTVPQLYNIRKVKPFQQ